MTGIYHSKNLENYEKIIMYWKNLILSEEFLRVTSQKKRKKMKLLYNKFIDFQKKMYLITESIFD